MVFLIIGWLLILFSFGFTEETESTTFFVEPHPVTGRNHMTIDYTESHINDFGITWILLTFLIPIVGVLIAETILYRKRKAKAPSIIDYQKKASSKKSTPRQKIGNLIIGLAVFSLILFIGYSKVQDFNEEKRTKAASMESDYKLLQEYHSKNRSKCGHNTGSEIEGAIERLGDYKDAEKLSQDLKAAFYRGC